MSVVIYYFSGTGNSLFLARRIAESTNGDVLSIAAQSHAKEIAVQADTVGIVFPVYYGDAPGIVQNFAARLRNVREKYLFVVCNYGGGSGESIATVGKALSGNGGIVSAAFGVHMPQNAFRKSWESYEKIYDRARKKCLRIADRIIKQEPGRLPSELVQNLAMRPLHSLFKPLYRSSLRKQSNAVPDLPMDALIHLADKAFCADDSCSGCGICEQVCPVQNIKMIGGRPEWQNRCENCLACYNWCPKQSIMGKIAQQGYFYKHPEIGLKDMIHR